MTYFYYLVATKQMVVIICRNCCQALGTQNIV